MGDITKKQKKGGRVVVFLLMLLISITIPQTTALAQIDWRGDLNINEYPFEMADAVLFIDYFMSGTDVFLDDPYWRTVQIWASDVNFDGIPLTISDFSFLTRIIVEEATPWDTVTPSDDTVYINTTIDGEQILVSSSSTDSIRTMLLVFGTTAEISNLVNHSDLNLAWNQNPLQLRVLLFRVFAGLPEVIPPGTNELFSFECEGDVTLDSIAAADHKSGEMFCPFTLCGDVDADGDVDLSDVIYLANYYLESGEPPPDPIYRANPNGDAFIDLSDVMYLANYVLKGGPQPYGCANYQP